MTWVTVECQGCGKRSRVEVPAPDTRARLDAARLLLDQSLGRPAVADDLATAPPLPASATAVGSMSWEDMQYLAGTLFVNEFETLACEGGEALLRERVAELSGAERRVLQRALDAAAA